MLMHHYKDHDIITSGIRKYKLKIIELENALLFRETLTLKMFHTEKMMQSRRNIKHTDKLVLFELESVLLFCKHGSANCYFKIQK